jgi:radical SAM protein with 4Fe4S-binding SPASM domain
MNSRTRICLQPWNTINVGADGVVYPCCVATDDLAIGDLATSSLEEMITGPRMRAIRERLLTGNLTGACEDCQNAPFGAVDEMHLALDQYLPVTAAEMGSSDLLARLGSGEGELYRVGSVCLSQVSLPHSGEVLELYSGFSPQAFLEGRVSLGEDFAIGCWVKKSVSVEPGIVLHHASPAAGGWRGPTVEVMIGPGGALQAAISPDGYQRVFLLGPIRIGEGRWTHMVVSKSGPVMHLFLDGVLAVSADTFPGSLHNPRAITRVGVNSGPGRKNGFPGSIGGLFIQDHALSEPAIEQLYKQEAFAFHSLPA